MSYIICNSLLIVSSILVCGLFIWRPPIGALAYLLAVLIAPQGHLGTWTPRPEQVMIIPLTLIGLFRLRRRPVFMSGWLLSFIGWVLWITVVALFSNLETDWMGVGGALRAIGVAWLFSQVEWAETDFRRAHFSFLCFAVPIGALAVGQVLSVPIPRSITEAAYTPWTSTVFLNQSIAEATGAIFRAVGTFGNVDICGTYFALALTVGVYLLSQKAPTSRGAKMVILISILFCLTGGVATQSGSFLAGTMTMLFGSVLVVRRVRRTRLIALILCALILGTTATMFFLKGDDQLIGNLAYQINGFLNGTRLDNRYFSGDSIGVAAGKDILSHPIAGIGAVQTLDYSLMDSLYISVIDQSGFVGGLLFFVPVFGIAWQAWRSNGKGDYVTLWTLAMLSTGVASSAMFSGRLGDWWWAVQGMFLSIGMSKSHSPARIGYRLPIIRPATDIASR